MLEKGRKPLSHDERLRIELKHQLSAGDTLVVN
jgi:hypothetical protein